MRRNEALKNIFKNRAAWKRQFQILGAIFVLLIIAFFVTEYILRENAWRPPQNYGGLNPSPKYSDPKEFRIMVLGDLTSANLMLRSWPNQLAPRLNAAGLEYTFKVFNVSVPSSTTAIAYTMFMEQVDYYRPHLVISMIGLNDTFAMDFKPEVGFWHWRTFQLLNLLKERWIAYAYSEKRPPNYITREEMARIEQVFMDELEIMEKKNETRWSEYQDVAAKVAMRFPGIEWYAYYYASRKLFIKLDEQSNSKMEENLGANKNILNIAFRLAEIAYEKNTLNNQILIQLIFLARIYYRVHMVDDNAWNPYIDRVKAMIKNSLENKKFKPEKYLLTQIPALKPNMIDEELHNIYKQNGVDLYLDKDYLQFSRMKYRQLADEILKRKIPYMAVQYPAARVDAFLRIFSTDEDQQFASLFVENELHNQKFFCSEFSTANPNFKINPKYRDIIFVSNAIFFGLLPPGGTGLYYEKLFGFLCSTRVGLPAGLGHGLIAENVYNTILEHWDKIRPH